MLSFFGAAVLREWLRVLLRCAPVWRQGRESVVQSCFEGFDVGACCCLNGGYLCLCFCNLDCDFSFTSCASIINDHLSRCCQNIPRVRGSLSNGSSVDSGGCCLHDTVSRGSELQVQAQRASFNELIHRRIHVELVAEACMHDHFGKHDKRWPEQAQRWRHQRYSCRGHLRCCWDWGFDCCRGLYFSGQFCFGHFISFMLVELCYRLVRRT
jgi:hypothetical protein